MNNSPKGKYNIFKLAAKNFKAYAWINIKMCFVFAILVFIICLFSSYNAALRDKIDSYEALGGSANYIYYNTTNNVAASAFAEREFPEAEWISFKSYRPTLEILKLTGEGISSATLAYFDFSFNGKLTEPLDDSFSLNAYSSDFPFTDGDLSEYKFRFNEDQFLFGRKPEKTGEVLMSEKLLEKFGFTKDAIGTEVSIKLKSGKDPKFTGTIVGVLSEKYYELTGHSGRLAPVLMFHEDETIFKSYSAKYYMAFVNGFLEEEYTKTMIKSGINYGATSLVNSINLLDNIMILGNTLYVVIGSALAVGLILTIFMMIGKYVRIFARASGIYQTFGLPRSRVNALLFCQLLLLDLVSVPVALALSALGYKVVSSVIEISTGMSLTISLGWLFSTFAMGVAAVTVISVLLFVFISMRIRKKTIKQLLTIND